MSKINYKYKIGDEVFCTWCGYKKVTIISHGSTIGYNKLPSYFVSRIINIDSFANEFNEAWFVKINPAMKILLDIYKKELK